MSRRHFLKALPAAAALPALAADERPAPTKGGLTIAQELLALDLGEAERERALDLVKRYRDHYEALRAIPIPSDTEPAFSFRPKRPKPAPPAARRQQRPASASNRPASDADLAFLPATALAGLLRTRSVSSVELTRLYLDRLARFDPKLFCVITRTEELALAQAERADREIGAGRYKGPLHGVPYGIKDLFATRGIRTTWGAKPFENQVFDHDATAVERLRDAGAVLIAKLTSGELAIGDLWFGGRTRNPWNPEKGSSGSSAGPAAAAAAGLAGFTVGTETGGSIVSPASTCGVVGLRPTYGRVSRAGCMTLRWTMDKVGVIARSVEDCMLVLGALHGPDGKDDSVADLPLLWDGISSLQGLRVGYVEREFDELASDASAEDRAAWPARRKLLEDTLDVFKSGAAQLVSIKLPPIPADALYAIHNAEAGAMFDDLVRSGRAKELANQGKNGRANQLHAARFIPAVEYIRAQRVRTLLVREINALFETCDVFLAPTSSASSNMTNLTGHPALVVPAGFVDGMPLGLLPTGRLYDEPTLARAGLGYERATTWHERRPPLA